MKCINAKCEKRSYCEKTHTLNDLKIGKDIDIVIPNRFFFELNISNRLAKIGVPSEGFEFGCLKMIQKNEEVEGGALYINDSHVADFELSELIEMSNNAFREMIANGEIKIG